MFALLTIIVATITAALAVDSLWYVHPGTSTNISYWTNTTKQDINEAHAYCISTGGKLAWVPDAGAMEVVKELKKNNGHEWSLEYYIGHKEVNNVVYVWGTTISQTYANWAPAQPDVDADTCVSVAGTHGYWKDEDCAEKFMVVCSDFAPSATLSSTVTNPTATTSTPTPVPTISVCQGLEYNDAVNNRVICYWTFTTTQNIEESETLCFNSGGYLAYIPDAGALAVAQQLRINDGNEFTPEYWIGYTVIGTTLMVRNTTRVQVYENWYGGQPTTPDHTCVVMYNTGAVWYDESCAKHYMAVCSSYSPAGAATPAPAAATSTAETTSLFLQTTKQITSLYTKTKTYTSLNQVCPVSSSGTTDCTLSNSACICGCSRVQNLTEAELDVFVEVFTEEVKRELIVDKKTLSSAVRKKTSADDSRPSSAAMGALGVVLLITVFGGIIINDIPRIIVGSKDIILHLKQFLKSRDLL